VPIQDKRGGEDIVRTHSLTWLQNGLDGLRNVSVALRPGKSQYPLYRGLDGLVVGLDEHEVSPTRVFNLRTVQPLATALSLSFSFVYLQQIFTLKMEAKNSQKLMKNPTRSKNA
jgi:hypothetical protein